MKKAAKPLAIAVVALGLTYSGAVFPKQMGVTDIALCTAAAMKSGQGIDLYRKWSTALKRRYQAMHPSYTSEQLDGYTAERTIDKRRELERRGIHTTPAFLKFFKDNCEPFSPF